MAYTVSCMAYPNPAMFKVSLPVAYADWVHQQLGASTISAGKYAFDCNKLDQLQNVSIVIDDYTYVLTPKDYVAIQETPIGKFCLSEIEGQSYTFGTDYCVLGVPFLARYYSYFETYNAQQQRPTVSFAPVKVE